MDLPLAYTKIETEILGLDGWEQRYHHLMALGRSLPRLDESELVQANRIHGCTAQVWLKVDHTAGVLTIRGTSDSLIVAGLMALLVAVYNGMPPRDVQQVDAVKLFDRLGLREYLTPQRSNGLVAMVARIREEARLQAAA